ncbi:MAG: sugar ABC transporter substrate-binding protein [Burkholderiales bacterium]|nr:sugar ABC transporter substrate-binding protein [Anaerolineae bacterium]
MKLRYLPLSIFCLLIALLSSSFAAAQEATPEAMSELGTEADLEPTEDEMAAALEALGEDGFIGIIACTFGSEYHFTVADTALQYATELGLRAEVFDSQVNVERQISAIESFTANGVDVLVICLFDPPSVLSALEAADAAGVKIVQYAGRQLADLGGVTISIEDADLGRAAGEYAATLITDEMGGEANVAILDYPDVANVVIRADAIRAALEEGAPNAVIVGNYLGGTTENGLASMESALIEHPEINVVVSINDAGAYGAMQALENAGSTDAILVGIDAEEQARGLILEGGMYRGTIDTSPARTGELTINAAIKLLAGSEIPQNVAVPVTLMDAAVLAEIAAEATPEAAS